MHKERDTWESPGGHIDEGETPLEAAERELYEETGAIDFDFKPQLPPNSEIKLIDFFDSFPDKLTYPMLRDYFPMALEKKNQKGV